MKTIKSICLALIWVAIVALIVGVIVYLSKMTNGFQEDFKTFYLQYEGKTITAQESKISIKPNSDNQFDIKYAMGFSVSDTSDNTYTVEVIPNDDYDDLVYTVDGEENSFGDIEDFSDIFKVERSDKYFIVKTPKDATLLSVLSAKYPEQTVEVSDELAKANNYYYTLRVSSYSGNTVFNINFNFALTINLDKDGIVF